MQEEAVDAQGRNQDLREETLWDRIILETIGNNGHDREIVARLRAGESHQVIADWLAQENPNLASFSHDGGSRRRLVDVVRSFEAQFEDSDGLNRSSNSDSYIRWTNVSKNHKLIGHLFDLYFTWIHPVHMLFSEIEFKKDFRRNQTAHCSSSLVNAICAMACNLHDSESMMDKWNLEDSAATLREGFMTEAKKAISWDTYYCMTTIQAFAVMYLVELSAGRARTASTYLRSAIDNMVKASVSEVDQQSKESKELSLLGLQTLNTYVLTLA